MSDIFSVACRIQASAVSRLVGWQFAADGDWDAAERIFLDSGSQQSASARAQQWLAQQTSADIALEALFEFANDERFFFGVRITHLDKRRKVDAINRLLTTNKNCEDLEKVVQNIRDALGDPKFGTTNHEYLELGVFDLWNKVKSLVVWRRNGEPEGKSKLMQLEEISSKTKKPDEGFAPLHEPQPNPLMLEAVWKKNDRNDFQYWVGLPVSDCRGPLGRYSISRDRYVDAASTFVGRAPA